MEVLLLLWIVCGGVGAAITNSKNRGVGVGLVLGLLLGIIGVLIAACLSKELPKPPAGLIAVQCLRCNANQNIPAGQPHYECWQCHTTIAAPGFQNYVPPAEKTRKVRCFNCDTVQMVSPRVATAACQDCGTKMKMPAPKTAG
ncbi:hypothetical protein [Mycolicibacterium sp. 624]|uniref:hypothetical protein n=1 Tax=Mycolicibacterium sp. 624 TaxID=3156314 RepID=UPI0033996AE5